MNGTQIPTAGAVETPMTSAAWRDGDQLVLSLSDRWIPVRYQLQLLNRCRPRGLLPCSLRQRLGQGELSIDLSGCCALPDWLAENPPDQSTTDSLTDQLKAVLHEAENRLLPAEQFDLDPASLFISRDPTGPLQLHLVFWPCADRQSEAKMTDDWSVIREMACRSLRQVLTLRQAPRPGPLDPPVGSAPATAGPDPRTRPPRLRLPTGLRSNRQRNSLLLLLVHAGVGTAGCFLLFTPASPVLRGFVSSSAALLFLTDIWGLLPGRIKESIRQKKARQWLMIRRQAAAVLQARQEKPIPTEADRLRETGLYPDDPALFRIAVLIPQFLEPDQQKTAARTTVHILVDQFIIGRDRHRCDLCLADPSIGRQHARISRSGGSFFITDLGSRNGSWLDQHRIDAFEELPLPDHCLLKFGQSLFLFQAES
ncbi:MAG: FHA domain-containing protein [Clostridia bacterium]|nr:FHA domain-containing protein [Clostridia bacterium]